MEGMEARVEQMRRGDAVPEPMIWGQQAGALLNAVLSRQILDNYRTGSVRKWLEVYQNDAHRLMANRFGGVVHPYFEQGE